MADLYIEVGPELNEAKEWGGEPFQHVDPGDYQVIIADIKRATSKNGNAMLVVQYEIAANADGTASTFTGRRLTGWYVLSGQGLSRLKNFLSAAGIATNERGGFDLSGAVGKKIAVTVHHEEYQGQDPNTLEPVTRTGTRVVRERASLQ